MMNKIRKLKEKKGFTLVELIVVIAIIAILTAVLVPLIGRWSTQASYTTLQDAAQTISNNANNAVNALVMKGKPCTSTLMVGVKTGGKLTVTVYPAGSDIEKTLDGGDVALVPMGDEDKDKTKYVIKSEMETSLDATLTDNCCFMVALENGAVTGVVYINGQTVDASDTFLNGSEVAQNKDFENAFQTELTVDSKSVTIPIGVSGIFMKEGKITVDKGKATMGEKTTT